MTTMVKPVGEEKEQFTLVPENEIDKKTVNVIRQGMEYDQYDIETGKLKFTRTKIS